METSAGLSEDNKYVVRLGDEKIATFTLVDQNKAEATTDIPDWQLGKVEFFFQRECSYFFEKQAGHTVYVNGTPLDDRATVRIKTTKAADYLPVGVEAPQTYTQQISGLIALPDVMILDENGNELPVAYDEATQTFAESVTTLPIGEVEKQTALEAVKTYALYMTERSGKREIAKYFSRSSQIYDDIINADRGAVQKAKNREFTAESVTNYCRYSDNLFSVRVSVTLELTRSDDSIKENIIEQSLFFTR